MPWIVTVRVEDTCFRLTCDDEISLHLRTEQRPHHLVEGQDPRPGTRARVQQVLSLSMMW